MIKGIGLLMAACFLFSCYTGKSTTDIPAVPNVDLDRYLGVWYEIARLDHKFERGLTNVTATYSLKEDSTVRVLNKGFKNGKEKTAEGKAKVPDKNQPGILSVSFFGPFYAPYKIIVLDPDYQYSMVTSSSRKYLWILSRTPKMDETVYQSLVERARDWGFDVGGLIRVTQE